MARKYSYHPTASGIQPDARKKEYCSYWIRTGECDYTQQGCRYKHEMPDLQVLNSIGFRDYPYWWKQRLLKRPLRPLSNSLRKILSQQSDSDGSCATEDKDSEMAFPLSSRLSSAIKTTESQQPSSFGSTSHITPIIPELIDFEPIRPQQIDRKVPQASRTVIPFIDDMQSNIQHQKQGDRQVNQASVASRAGTSAQEMSEVETGLKSSRYGIPSDSDGAKGDLATSLRTGKHRKASNVRGILN